MFSRLADTRKELSQLELFVVQAAADPFLGWTSGLQLNGAGAKEYYVRQLRDMKGAMNVPAMDPPQLTYYAGLCGWALARSHARTGRAAMISGYLGSSDQFDLAIEEFAVAYAEQNQLKTSPNPAKFVDQSYLRAALKEIDGR